MFKYLSLLALTLCTACQVKQSLVSEHVAIQIYPYEYENKMKAYAMPEFKADSVLMRYKRRFDYLLINVSDIHQAKQTDERNAIFNRYPDTATMQRLYLKKFKADKKLNAYFEATMAPINNPTMKRPLTYTADELMEVASKFFYCDKVEADSSIQAHVCVGLNGVKEAKWNNDYTLLEAFCYEGIFHGFDSDSSKIWDNFVANKKQAGEYYKKRITTLDQYLEDVKLALFAKMKEDTILKQELLAYYELNKTNLAFKIIH